MVDLHRCVVLDDGRAGLARVFADPSRCIVAEGPDEVPAALSAMQTSLAAGRYLAGYLTYELGFALEPSLCKLMPHDRALPLLWFGVFDAAPASLDGVQANSLWPHERVYATPLAFEWDGATYRSRFNAIMAAIRDGAIYEANLSTRARFTLTGDPRALYGRLRQHAGVAHGAFVDDGKRQLLSLSPESFFAIDAHRTITTRPMKGTAARGSSVADDVAQRRGLHASPKNRAENLMIVDLLRNDLGRIAETGSVEVPELFTIEAYPTLYQMTSTVRATVAHGCGVAEILKALFPCGSVTGAPKIRAMRMLRSVEDSPRGAYCGAIGMFAPNGRAEFNVAIRTVTVQDGQGELGVGGAIVADSVPGAEFNECLLKARYFDDARHAVSLLETMAYTGGSWPRRARHLKRLRNSAHTLGIPFNAAQAAAALDAAVAPHPASAQRVRLALHENGTLAVTTSALPPTSTPLKLALFPMAILSTDPLNRHKTDWRDTCERALAWARSSGCDEAVFVNERGEISEGTYTNVFVARSGTLLTPPLSSGALPGCLRAELLETGQCNECVLTRRDLQRADCIYLGNSLRGLLPAKLQVSTHR